MNEEDLSDIMKKITDMIGANNSTGPTNDSSNESNSNNSSNTNNTDNTNNSSNSNNFNIDIATLLKMKTIMDKMNTTQNDPRSNLLLSLKPYLKPNRKDKLDQYVKLLNMSSIFELFKTDESDNGGENK